MRVVLLALALSQSLLLPKPSTLQQITVAASVSAPTVAKGGTVTLWADVTPKANIHVYATDKYDFTPVSLIFAPQPRITFGTVKYPTPEAGISPGTDMLIPMYTKPFRLTQSVTISPTAKSGEALTISGAVNYEACNDRLCFPATSLPVTWAVTVK
jgi:cytochrome c biogenesis DsbD-like protein